MKFATKLFVSAGMLLGAIGVAPVAAQVDGRLATASVERALLGTTGLQTALQQVGTTYQAQLASAQTKQAELTALIQPFDTNANGTIEQNEAAGLQGAANFPQIQALRGEIAAIEDQVTAAQVYAVEQVLAQYQAALSEVAAQQQVVMIVDPSSLQYVSEGADITQQVSAALAARVPTVGIVPPEGWRPSQQSVQIFQDIQRAIIIQQARQQQQQQGAAQAPSGR